LKGENAYRRGEETVAVEDVEDALGLQMCIASPWSSERRIVVQSGLPWGRALPTNHKLDLLPNFIVYDGRIEPQDLTNRAFAAGWWREERALKNYSTAGTASEKRDELVAP
jgi:hypothetical protein